MSRVIGTVVDDDFSVESTGQFHESEPQSESATRADGAPPPADVLAYSAVYRDVYSSVGTPGTTPSATAPPPADGAVEEPVDEPADEPVDEPAASDDTPAAGDEPAPPAPRAADATKKGNPRHDPIARINALTREREEARREAAALKAENETLRHASTRPTPQASPTVAPPKFTFPSFDDWQAADPARATSAFEEYMEERAVSRVRHEQAQERSHDAAARADQARQQHVAAFHGRVATFKTTHPEYETLVQRSPVAQMDVPPWMGDVILTSEAGPALQYHLLKDPSEFQRIAALPPTAAIKELGRLEERLTAASSGSASPSTPVSAKPPIKPVGSSPVSSDDEPPGDDASFEAHKAYWDRKDREARRR